LSPWQSVITEAVEEVVFDRVGPALLAEIKRANATRDVQYRRQMAVLRDAQPYHMGIGAAASTSIGDIEPTALLAMVLDMHVTQTWNCSIPFSRECLFFLLFSFRTSLLQHSPVNQ
jgi:hypothetical protein